MFAVLMVTLLYGVKTGDLYWSILILLIYNSKKVDIERVYKVPLYPIVPGIAIVGGGFVLINQLFMAGSGPRMVALAGIGITLIGLPIYLIMTRKKAE